MRKHAYWGLTLVTTVFAVLVMASDVLLRPNVPPGANPRSWDIIGSTLLLAWMVATAVCFWDGWRPKRPLIRPLPDVTYRESEQRDEPPLVPPDVTYRPGAKRVS